MQKDTKSHLIRRYFKFLKPYRYKIITIVGLGILQFVVPMTVPWMTKILIDEVLPLKESSWTLSKVIGVLGGVYVFGTAVNYVRQWVMAKMGNSMVIDIRFQLYEHMQKLSQRFYDSRQVGSIVSRILNDVNGAQNLVGAGVINLAIDFFLVLFAGFMVFHMDWKLALLSLWMLPVYYLTFTNINVHIRFAWRSVHRQMERMSGVLVERIAGMKVVQAFSRERMELNRFKKQASAHFGYAMTAQFLSNTLGRISQTFQDFGGLIIWFVGGTMVIQGKMSVGGLIAFQAYLSQMYGPIQRFSDVNVTIQNSLANVERIFEVFDIEPEIQNNDNPVPLKTCKGEIQFDQVGFDYVIERPEKQQAEVDQKDKDLVERQKPAKRFYWIPPRMRPDPPLMVLETRAALKGISFKASSGDVIALVGPSGAGKSTIINLLLRFYDPDQGSVLLDGVDLRDYDLHDLRSHMALVLQDNILFSGTVYENIAYGNPKAPKEQIIAAAQAANAHEFIEEWEFGYETMIGERGVRLSGGQKQRIAIARALLKSPRILILDEATSALDAESEHLVTEALERLMQGRTTFVIAHRLATVVRADQILVIDRGRIVERGKHQVLLAQHGLYRELYEKQLRAMRPEELIGLDVLKHEA